MSAPRAVLTLVARFREHRDEYLSASYNEATLRKEFLEPLFAAMGWDVDNTKGYAEAYKEVIHEDALKVSGATKAPDYAFRLGGARKFFVEAKKPSVDVKGDPSPAYQLRRYAWSAKLPLSILTDFHEFAVYDCTKKPSPTDTSATARILYLTCEDYAARWEEIANLFSPEAIQKGAFDQFAASARRKKGTAAVDDAFLKEIEAWRDLLARHLALRNADLSQRELNDAVQRTIDRIIFLRICEDRGIEPYGELQALLNGTRVYPRLAELFRRADERYNSGLFHFKPEKDRPGSPDTLTLTLEVDDKVLKEILGSLYYPVSPYEFSVLPLDLLGHVYEQFLGKVIRLTAGHRAVVEDKPEVKKAGGVYYTPTYIVDYIVKNTVGKLLEGKTPKEATTLRVLDPACGSGSFLLGAYQCLLDWYQDWYTKNDPEKWARGRSPKLYRGPKGDWRLTTAERKRILLDHLYGVDIDPQAVEVTKLSLLLKVLEGENAETLGKTLKLLHERALPDLGRNIQCGNSLIGTDFYDDHPLETLTEEERYRINAFDWETAFPDIMKKGGFDAVIGNPPYGRDILSEFKTYFDASYSVSQYKVDAFVFFIERAVRLLRAGGRLGYIVPNTWLNTKSFSRLRRFLLDRVALDRLVNLGKSIFLGANVDTMLVFCRIGQTSETEIVDATDHSLRSLRLQHPVRTFTVSAKEWAKNPDAQFAVQTSPSELPLLRRVFQNSAALDALTECTQGLIPYGTRDESKGNPYVASVRTSGEWKPFLDKGSCVQRYRLAWNGLYVKFGPWLYTANEERFYTNPKILIQRHRNPSLSRRIVAAYDDGGFYFKDSLCGLIERESSPGLKPVLGLLNSTLMNFVLKRTFTEVSLNPTYLRQLPIPGIEEPPLERDCRWGELGRLVDQMLQLSEALGDAQASHDRNVLQRQIEATDRKIDQLVYEFYGLTDEEIRTVEEAKS